MIKPLTSLRFIFAWIVFISHLTFLEQSENPFFVWLFQSICKEGYIGVSFFFILSGFILSYRYENIVLNKEQIKKFYVARFSRIYPLHVLTLLLAIPLTIHILNRDIAMWLIEWIANLTLTQSFIPIKSMYFSFNSLSWSISNEMFFYLLFPMILWALRKFKIIKNLLLPVLIGIAIVLVFLIPRDFQHQIFYIHPFLRIIDFIIGIYLFQLFTYVKKRKFELKYNFLEASSSIFLILFFCLHHFIPQVLRYSFYYWFPISYLLFSFSFQKGILSKLLSNKVCVYLGEISFAFYMFHQLILRYFEIFNRKFFQIDNESIVVLCVFFLSLAVSHFSYILYEKPIAYYLKNRLGTRK